MQMNEQKNKNLPRKIIIWKIDKLKDKGIKIIKSISKKFYNLTINRIYRLKFLEII